MYLTLLSITAFTTFSFARTLNLTCATTNASVTICAELYNSTDCSGPITVVTGAGCHNIYAQGGGSINVRKGTVFAGFPYEDCRGNFELLAGPTWKGTDQGCQVFERGNAIKSWNSW